MKEFTGFRIGEAFTAPGQMNLDKGCDLLHCKVLTVIIAASGSISTEAGKVGLMVQPVVGPMVDITTLFTSTTIGNTIVRRLTDPGLYDIIVTVGAPSTGLINVTLIGSNS